MRSLPEVVIVSATTAPSSWFPKSTLLGRSLSTIHDSARPKLFIRFSNRGSSAIGLPAFYNHAISALNEDAIAIFVHDDIWIHDWNHPFHISQGLEHFDIVGVVGAQGGVKNRPGWLHYIDNQKLLKDTTANLSGSINHFDHVSLSPNIYGPSPLPCDVLDGAFIAAKISTLRNAGVYFDPQFRFHCYDIDFCYTAKSKGLTLGTWPIALTHGSGGRFDEQWVQAAEMLTAKWAAHESRIEWEEPAESLIRDSIRE